MAQPRARTEFAAALAQIAAERGVSPETVLETIKAAILAAYHRDAKERGVDFSEEDVFTVEINDETGEARIFKVEGEKKEDLTPPGFSRIAAQVAKQIILQKIREAEKSAILDEYSKKAGSLISGMILRFDGPNIIVDIGKAEAVMPPQEQVRSENYQLNQRLTFYFEGVREEGTRGPQIIVSRASKELVRGLFKREVPEVSSGAVEIKEIAREPGARTKIAVLSNRPGIDPVGSCVGQKGVRVQQVIDELFGEKIDIIPYSAEPVKLIVAALLPAEGLKVKIDEEKKTSEVIVPDDQLSLAIGKGGQNVRLAAKMSGYKIEIKSQEGAKAPTPAAKVVKKKKTVKSSTSSKKKK